MSLLLPACRRGNSTNILSLTGHFVRPFEMRPRHKNFSGIEKMLYFCVGFDTK
jgi:hypothetical protein